jgi:predicted TIM-barrel fold metal-dependent hydrolase
MGSELPKNWPTAPVARLGRRVVDFHQHIGFSSRWTINPPAEVVAKLRAAGFCGSVVFCFEKSCGEGYREANDKVLAAARQWPELCPFARVDLADLQESVDELLRAHEAGCEGLKLHPLSDAIDPDADHVGRFIEEVTKLGIPLILHTQKDPGSEPLMWERHIRNHPEQTFILGHAGFFKWRDSMLLGRKYDNVYLEASLCPRLPSEQIVEFVRADRILFGSDMPYGDDVGSYHTMLDAIRRAYSGEELERVAELIFVGNAERVLGREFPAQPRSGEVEVPARPTYQGVLHAAEESAPCTIYDLLDRDASVIVDGASFDPMDARRLTVHAGGQRFEIAVRVVCGAGARFACEFEAPSEALQAVLREERQSFFY